MRYRFVYYFRINCAHFYTVNVLLIINTSKYTLKTIVQTLRLLREELSELKTELPLCFVSFVLSADIFILLIF
jgi:hypothetical protein